MRQNGRSSQLRALAHRKPLAVQKPFGYEPESLFQSFLGLRFFLCYSFLRHDFHRDEANYHDDVYVDYLD